jgi:hypothetical protein
VKPHRILLEQASVHGLQWLERNFATGIRISYQADNRNAHNEIKNQERKSNYPSTKPL